MSPSQSVLITGATAGIGRHAALHLARAGWRVFATGRNRTALDALAAEAAGTPLETLELDVTDADSIARAKTEIHRRTRGAGLDAIVNNAGYSQPGPLEEVSDADLRAVFETNVFGLMAVTRAFVPAMRERGRGRVINVSSVMGRLTMPFNGAYCATKYAVEALSDALRNELAAFGIKVVIIEPGPIKTNFNDTALRQMESYRSGPSPYAGIAEKADEIVKEIESRAFGPEVVTKAIEKALTARNPAARYLAPRFTPEAVLMHLPSWITDRLIGRILGLSNLKSAITATPQRA
jgi:NAD(P)-dependent dehydrogenase (short-subunit alcohol dehydrogenase family)